jgi:hypothetical protein
VHLGKVLLDARVRGAEALDDAANLRHQSGEAHGATQVIGAVAAAALAVLALAAAALAAAAAALAAAELCGRVSLTSASGMPEL